MSKDKTYCFYCGEMQEKNEESEWSNHYTGSALINFHTRCKFVDENATAQSNHQLIEEIKKELKTIDKLVYKDAGSQDMTKEELEAYRQGASDYCVTFGDYLDSKEGLTSKERER